MSDSHKLQRSGATPVKNPLLSASVTGLTFDDFPNKPLLLPAAPPIVHAAPVVTPSGLVGREPKSLVIVGSSSLDTENLDEINLNTSSEDNQAAAIIDPNANSLLEEPNQSTNSDSILSQAASSFSALPSVASNVFSTFSKRITAISSRETTPFYDQYQQDPNVNPLAPQLDIQPTYTQQQQLGDSSQAPPPFYASPLHGGAYFPGATIQPDTHNNLPPAEPPKFYTPAEIPVIPSASARPPTNLGAQNNFRFSSKKKLYAPIPGLSDQSQKPTTTLEQSHVNANNSYQQSQYSSFDDPKTSSGLFSKISNLAPTGVLQNITGLVQSAAGSLTQTVKTDSYQQAVPSPVLDQKTNYFGGPPATTNYFSPSPLSGQQVNVDNTPIETSQTRNFLNQPPTSGPLPPASVLFQNSPPSSTSLTKIPFFNPSNVPSQINPSPQPNRPPSAPPSHPSTPYLSTNLNEQEVSNPIQSNSTDQSAQVGFFDPTKYLPPSSYSGGNLSGDTLPPTFEQKIPPPAVGHTSYRLQKGTKLYKNPLTPQETAPTHVAPIQIQSISQPLNTFSTQSGFVAPQSASLFAQPPLAPPNEPTQSVPLLVPPPLGHPLQSTPYQVIQSVPELAPPPPPVTDLLSNKSEQSLSLFDPKSYKTVQSVPLYVQPTEESTQSSSLIVPQSEELHIEDLTQSAPPVKKLKYNEPIETIPLCAAPIEEKKDITINETEQSASAGITKQLDSSQNILATRVPNQNTNSNIADNKESESIFEPIEPIAKETNSELPKEVIGDTLEQTLQKLSLTTETFSETNTVLLPPITTHSNNLNNSNPYRRGSNSETLKPSGNLPTLANFFAPLPPSGSGDLNFFATLPAAEPNLDNSNSGINFFSQTAENTELQSQNDLEVSNFLATSVNSSGSEVYPDLIPIQPDTALQPPTSAFFPKLPTSLGLVPVILEDKSEIAKYLIEPILPGSVPPPVGFESFVEPQPSVPEIADNTTVEQKDENTTLEHEISNTTQQLEVVNRFSNFFNQSNHQTEISRDPSTFFDSFPGQQPPKQQQVDITTSSAANATNEEQRIQYFFNNPPPKEASTVGDLNYDLVHSGLGVKNLQQRSITPVSNLVEPPSSACSEFSEISNSTSGQKSISANISVTENSDKSIEKEHIKSTENSVNLEKDSIAGAEFNIKHYEELPEEILKELRMANMLSADKLATTLVASVSYKPAVKHWFFKRTINDKPLWIPFSHYDSALLETSLESDDRSNIVAVEGGRYDVNIAERKKMSVYWESEPIEVRRCSWFYKAIDSKYVPYEEQTADILENDYKQAVESGVWHKKIILGMGEQVEFHSPTVIVHFQQQQNADAWGGTTQTATRPRVVKRDLDDFHIEQGESQKVDHLLFMVHGIGSACDLKLRSVEEVVEDFRTIARQLVQSHYKNSTDLGLVGRVEVLPISWHSHLHSVEVGIDEKLRTITLESIPKLRNFTNDTLLDILFYTSPTYCQKIMNTIVSSLNSLYLKYRERHPEFNGGVSLAGHSLGSLILFDLLCNQNSLKESEDKNVENPDQYLTAGPSKTPRDSNQLAEDRKMSYTNGPAGTGQPFINYGQLIFQPKKFFALGSPIGMFVTIRGIDKLGLDFRLPTCPGFYNIFHPYDPVAYRIEALVNPDLSGVRPVLIPHHKGRKRMHLELKETMTRVSMDLKNRFLDKFKTTLDSVNIFGSPTKSTKEAEELMEKEVDKVIQMQMQLEQQNHNQNSPEKLPSISESQSATPRLRTDSVSTAMSDDPAELDFPLGKLNDSKRIDYVLQEAPLEFINEYIFALSSHVCYWDSEDTILFVMKEIYSGLGISPDSQVPQQTMTIERPSSRNSLLSSS